MVTDFLINHRPAERVEPMFKEQVIDIAVDPSKSHTGIVIALADDSRKVAIECLAGGGDIDVFEACAEIHEFMNTILQGSIIRLAGVEDPITKGATTKDKYGRTVHVNPGMETHENRLKLSAIFTTFMNVIRLNAHHEVMRINNNSWKQEVLPPEYRTRAVGKGSNLWLPTVEPGYKGYDDNVTDAGCMILYLRKVYKAERVICKSKVESAEIPLFDYEYAITDCKPYKLPIFIYNPLLTFEENLAYVANRSKNSISVIEIDVNSIPIKEIYGDAFKASDFESKKFMILIEGGASNA